MPLCKSATQASKFKVVLITGATGQFGACILKDLIKNKPDLTVYRLIRAETAEHAQKRLQDKLKEYDLFHDVDLKNVIFVAGDVRAL